jgi:hypothetical protein
MHLWPATLATLRHIDHLRRVRPHDEPTYRVELCRPRRITVLGVVSGEKPSVRTLDPYTSRLTLDGVRGTVRLVEEATGTIVARRCLGASPRR